MQPLIFDIQGFSVHDGDGIRTTVFFKGCPLRCAWCHNPEGQSFSAEWMRYKERCIGCGRCADGVDEGFICASGARVRVGGAYSSDELTRLLMRDRQFYDGSGGGVTLSGGEVMAQDIDYIADVCRKLKRRGVSVAIDTCGQAPYASFERVLSYADEFLYDIKTIDPELHRQYTGVSNELILENARRLANDGARINVRVPVIPGVNDGDEMRAIVGFAREIAPFRVNLLPYHRLGADKAERLGGEAIVNEFTEPSPEHMRELIGMWREAGITNVFIGG